MYLYTNDGLVALTHLDRLHRAFDKLASLFDWVGLWMNVKKTVSMAYFTRLARCPWRPTSGG